MASRLILLLLFPASVWGIEPLIAHKEPPIKHEFERVYKEIENVRSKTGQTARVLNLQISRVSATSNHVLYDWIALEDGRGNIVTSGERQHRILTGEMTDSDPGGFDQSASVPADSWIAVHVITNGKGSFVVRYSTTSNKPTLPSGYPYWGHVGWVRTDSSSEIVPFLQDGDFFQYKNEVAIIAGQTTGAATNTTTDVSSAIPPMDTAWSGYFRVSLEATYSDSASKDIIFQLSGPLLGSYSSGSIPPVIYSTLYQASASIRQTAVVKTITNETDRQIIWYAAPTSTNRSSYTIDIYCRGFWLNLFD